MWGHLRNGPQLLIAVEVSVRAARGPHHPLYCSSTGASRVCLLFHTSCHLRGRRLLTCSSWSRTAWPALQLHPVKQPGTAATAVHTSSPSHHPIPPAPTPPPPAAAAAFPAMSAWLHIQRHYCSPAAMAAATAKAAVPDGQVEQQAHLPMPPPPPLSEAAAAAAVQQQPSLQRAPLQAEGWQGRQQQQQKRLFPWQPTSPPPPPQQQQQQQQQHAVQDAPPLGYIGDQQQQQQQQEEVHRKGSPGGHLSRAQSPPDAGWRAEGVQQQQGGGHHHHHQGQLNRHTHPHHYHQQQQQQQQQQSQGRRRPPPPPHHHLTDMSSPASWFPLARSLGPRALTAHLGPTNSGKTHAALEALRGAASGLYAGPLRLLAAEVADRLNAAGVPCDLVTGQEVVRVPGARHVACTVEMAGLEAPLEVAVLDEIQMVGDANRGWAWTRALLGIPARQLHVCGEPTALPLLQQLSAHCADDLTVQSYQRLTPLVVETTPVGGVGGIRSGDCVVAFSRRWLHRLRKHISRSMGAHVTGMVYGALPPEARRSQAAQFNRPGSGVDVLVASDAIGMGLNLNIRRVVFATMSKFDGDTKRPLTPSEVKQIAGRAGRFASDHPQGYVAVMEGEDVGALQAALLAPSPEITSASLLPRFDQLARWASQTGAASFAEALQTFASAAQLSPPYALADLSNLVAIARLLRHLEGPVGGLGQEELYTWCCSPAAVEDRAVAQALLAFASAYSSGTSVTLEAIPSQQHLSLPTTEPQLTALEELFRVYDLYVWLAGRFPGAFPDRLLALERRSTAAQLVDQGLNVLGQAAAAAAAPMREGNSSSSSSSSRGSSWACTHNEEHRTASSIRWGGDEGWGVAGGGGAGVADMLQLLGHQEQQERQQQQQQAARKAASRRQRRRQQQQLQREAEQQPWGPEEEAWQQLPLPSWQWDGGELPAATSTNSSSSSSSSSSGGGGSSGSSRRRRQVLKARRGCGAGSSTGRSSEDEEVAYA